MGNNETPQVQLLGQLHDAQRRACENLALVKDPHAAQVLAELCDFAATVIVVISRLAADAHPPVAQMGLAHLEARLRRLERIEEKR